MYALVWCAYFALSRQPVSRKLARFALVSLSLAFSAGLPEVPAVLGLLDYRIVISPPASAALTTIKPWDDPRNLPDRELLWLRRPGQHITGETRGDLVDWLGVPTNRRYAVDIQYDSHGFRNPEELSTASVVAIGDSFLEGVLVPGDQLVSAQLAERLGVEVANLGQSGYGPPQQLAVLRRFGLELQPDAVVWFFFEGNDLLDVPRFERLLRERDQAAGARGLAARSFWRNLLQWADGVVTDRANASGVEAHRRSCTYTRAQSDQERTIYFAYPGVPLTSEDEASLQLAQRSMLQARDLAVARGSEFVVVYVPSNYRVYRDFCEFPADGYGRDWRPNDLPARFEAWSRANGVAYLDLTPSLSRAAASGQLVYFVDDGHWNPKGHAIAAEAIAAFLRDRPSAGGALASGVRGQ